MVGFGSVSGQSWAQDRYERPRLGKSCINQRELARETDSKDQRDPEVFLLAKFFLEAGCAEAKNPQIFVKILVVWPCRLRRQGQETIFVLEEGCFLGLGTVAAVWQAFYI